MITVEVRNDHGIHIVAVDVGRGEVIVELTGPAFALLKLSEPETGVDDDQLGPGVDDNRAERMGDLVRRQMAIGKHLALGE